MEIKIQAVTNEYTDEEFMILTGDQCDKTEIEIITKNDRLMFDKRELLNAILILLRQETP